MTPEFYAHLLIPVTPPYFNQTSKKSTILRHVAQGSLASYNHWNVHDSNGLRIWCQRRHLVQSSDIRWERNCFRHQFYQKSNKCASLIDYHGWNQACNVCLLLWNIRRNYRECAKSQSNQHACSISIVYSWIKFDKVLTHFRLKMDLSSSRKDLQPNVSTHAWGTSREAPIICKLME